MNKLIITNKSAALVSEQKDESIVIKVTDCFGSASIELSDVSAKELIEHLQESINE